MSIRESLDDRSPLVGRDNFSYLFTGGSLRFRPGRWNLDAVDRVCFDEFCRIRGIGQTAGKKTFQVYQGIPAVSLIELFIDKLLQNGRRQGFQSIFPQRRPYVVVYLFLVP